MLSIRGYQFPEKIYESGHSLVFRGVRESDQRQVVAKVLNREYPTSKEIAQFKQEFKITKGLNIEGVIRIFEIQKHENSLGLIVEDIGGESLAKTLSGQKMPLDVFLATAIQISEALGQIHQQNVIHKDINPANIVWNKTLQTVKIIDFGISTLLTRETSFIKNPGAMEGTLKYISPEQTGRMNRALDYRTDLYSLGATFYEMLCGRSPFPHQSALEQVHAHIALEPTPPTELNLHIPEPISQLILKLLAKTPEDRYQSAFGVAADLKFFQQQLRTTGTIQDGILARWDLTDRFQIPEKLYGRDQEIQALLTFFDRANAGQPSMVLVSGYSGIGKSSIVQEIHKPIVAAKGTFITGKFDQFRRNIPYASLIQAFTDLVRQLLAESQEKIAYWQTALQQALRHNGQVIVEVIPEVELIIGPQPPVPELSPNDSENRFHLVFESFVKTFAIKDHPLVLFLDDLQWADTASLKLIERFATDPSQRYMLIIGAYRDNEVDDTHPLSVCIEELTQAGAEISQIQLGPLSLPDINQLIADTLHQPTTATVGLAHLCLEKTDGNPFFLNQFLQILYREQCIEFDSERRLWHWDLARIKRMEGTENVAAFMANHIRKLPVETQDTLKLAACIGNQFDLKTLACICEESPRECAEKLWQALKDGYLLPLDDNYKIIDDWQEAEAHYRFLHDQVQQAAYAMIADDQKKLTHLHIGRLLLANSDDATKEERLFATVNHLNEALEHIHETEEKLELATLNLRAGKKAKYSAAFGPAYRYFNTGLSLLPVDSWQSHYELTLALHVQTAEAAYLNANFKHMEAMAQLVMANATSLLDRVKVYEIKIFAHLSNNNPVEAAKTGFFILRELGYSFPENPTKLSIISSLLKTKMALVGKKIEDLANLPAMTDPTRLAAIRIMSSIISAAYITKPELFVLLTFQQVRLSAKFGNAKPSVFTYTAYGVMLCGVLGDIENGYRFGKMALTMLPESGAHEYKAKTVYSFHTFLWHWKEDAKKGLRPLLEAYQAGLETGDLEYAGWSVFVYNAYSILIGRDLNQLDKDLGPYVKALATFKHEMAETYAAICHQAMLNLLGRSESPCELCGTRYNESERADFHNQGNDQLANFLLYFFKMMLCFLFSDFKRAVEIADKALPFMESAAGKMLIPFFHYFDSLARLALLEFQPEKRGEYWKTITANQKKLHKWASIAPVNHQHKYDLVAAEMARVQGHHREAKDHYELATSHARANDFLFEEALGFELAAKYYLGNRQKQLGQFFLKNAFSAYQRWGASAKVAQLKRRYADSFTQNWNQTSHSGVGSIHWLSNSSSESSSEVLDLETVMKAAQTLSSEIVLDKLVGKMMQIAFENAGAQRGLLVVRRQEQWYIEASTAVPGVEPIPTTGDRFSDQNSRQVPIGIIQFVQRVQDHLVLQDATEEETFANDAYVLAIQPRSILCIPLLKQGELIAVLYLENNLTTEAFTPERIEVLKILSSQAAISLENAHLYSSLEKYSENLELTVGERTREVRQKNEQLISSIRYAQRIQDATLPDLGDLIPALGEAFVVFKPRDIVSGDFFWFSIRTDDILVAVIDCTGHGVPGALLSMMGNSLLNQIVNQQRISEPAEILSILDERVRDALRQEQGAESTDGMELCICRIDRNKGSLAFAGSRRPLYLVREGELLEFKGDRRSVGGRRRMKVREFTQKDITTEPGDRLYLTSDGFADQASPFGKKYGSRQLKNFLKSLADTPFKNHEEALQDELNRHQNNEVQVDDITLLGIQL